MTTNIPGYTYGSAEVAKSPLSMDDFANIKHAALFGDEDVRYLKMSRDILKDQVEQILDVWYGFVGSTPFLLHYFTNKSDNQPNTDYLGAVRKRFGQWILDTANANYDQDWLNYQYEIGLRHHSIKKNKTDNVDAVPIINLRYILALQVPITTTLRPFLEKDGHSSEDVDKMQDAWRKSVLMQVILWSQPYIHEGQF
ncbi:Protoglobin [Nitrosomonas aestuarii]|uniref:Protoglobin n=1 Tax=Nitrosomonas aestuarii TaxID=52441 RepID=A0A1I4BKS1_9PROT|nr:protoglobin domain-containing protein [Nitrosomonas aestuarii]SFK68481.1 Protoglobin [Nitrosomonas aestuarii]